MLYATRRARQSAVSYGSHVPLGCPRLWSASKEQPRAAGKPDTLDLEVTAADFLDRALD
jgi:hypothetical protein